MIGLLLMFVFNCGLISLLEIGHIFPLIAVDIEILLLLQTKGKIVHHEELINHTDTIPVSSAGKYHKQKSAYGLPQGVADGKNENLGFLAIR